MFYPVKFSNFEDVVDLYDHVMQCAIFQWALNNDITQYDLCKNHIVCIFMTKFDKEEYYYNVP
jgi:hypothetical protein